ncbi:hypothetical protein E0H35_34430 [Rhizobium leguminosarum bv. viciae]|nr:hypothetical protein [Rhizobium leguminosarum bv. viciae]TBY88057.1 hypothetical protein E0H35_34430 [Rhizobium leguminosarum bv. viciae]
MAAPHPNPLPVNGARGRALRKVGGGTERSRHSPFAPQAGRRWRQPDEGLAPTLSNNGPVPRKPSVTSVRAPGTLRNRTGR